MLNSTKTKTQKFLIKKKKKHKAVQVKGKEEEKKTDSLSRSSRVSLGVPRELTRREKEDTAVLIWKIPEAKAWDGSWSSCCCWRCLCCLSGLPASRSWKLIFSKHRNWTSLSKTQKQKNKKNLSLKNKLQMLLCWKEKFGGDNGYILLVELCLRKKRQSKKKKTIVTLKISKSVSFAFSGS